MGVLDSEGSGLTPGRESDRSRSVDATDSIGQLGNALKRFEVRTGTAECGWCEFSVRLGDDSWSCNASYISDHPLNPLIHSAVDLYNHIFENPIPIENAVWDSLAADEPGGIVIRATPEGECLRVRIYRYDEVHFWGGDTTTLPEIQPAAEGLVDYWAYADAIVEDGARAIARQGITGLRNGWQHCRWDIDAHFEVLPVEHFLYLAALVKYRAPKVGMNLEEELLLLRGIQAEYSGT